MILDDEQVRDARTETDELERREGFDATHVYEHALRGFSAELSDSQAAGLREDPAVVAVTEDRRVKAHALDQKVQPGDTVPFGLERIGAAKWVVSSQGGQPWAEVEPASNTSVAVLDTGIDLAHPDLNAEHGKDCIDPGTQATDPKGHGTHVAGTIGARNNGSGAVGVVPDTRVWAVRVLNETEGGWISEVVCGLDWVAANATRLSIRVINMSYGGEVKVDWFAGSDIPCDPPVDAEFVAICNVVKKGVTPVASAGNDAQPIERYTPAAFDNVLTATAMADGDGIGGGKAGAFCSPESDDTTYTLSNFAYSATGIPGDADHVIPAPGVCVWSTVPGGGHDYKSGTSMASPHVAGLAALCIGTGGDQGPCDQLEPDEIIDELWHHAMDHRYDASKCHDCGFEGDAYDFKPDADVPYVGFLAWRLGL